MSFRLFALLKLGHVFPLTNLWNLRNLVVLIDVLLRWCISQKRFDIDSDCIKLFFLKFFFFFKGIFIYKLYSLETSLEVSFHVNFLRKKIFFSLFAVVFLAYALRMIWLCHFYVIFLDWIWFCMHFVKFSKWNNESLCFLVKNLRNFFSISFYFDL